MVDSVHAQVLERIDIMRKKYILVVSRLPYSHKGYYYITLHGCWRKGKKRSAIL